MAEERKINGMTDEEWRKAYPREWLRMHNPQAYEELLKEERLVKIESQLERIHAALGFIAIMFVGWLLDQSPQMRTIADTLAPFVPLVLVAFVALMVLSLCLVFILPTTTEKPAPTLYEFIRSHWR